MNGVGAFACATGMSNSIGARCASVSHVSECAFSLYLSPCAALAVKFDFAIYVLLWSDVIVCAVEWGAERAQIFANGLMFKQDRIRFVDSTQGVFGFSCCLGTEGCVYFICASVCGRVRAHYDL